MIKVVSWNIGRRIDPWHELIRMAECGDADLALLQEAGSPPDELKDSIQFDGRVFWDHALYDRLPLIVRLSNRVTIQPYRQVAPKMELAADEIGISGIGTIAAARVTPVESEQEEFIAVSMYASWLTPHPSASSARHPKRYSDASAHRIISDLATFIGSRRDPSKHRVLAAGDLNMCYGATGRSFRCLNANVRCGIGCERWAWSSWGRRSRMVGLRDPCPRRTR